MDFQKFSEWAFQLILSGSFLYAVGELRGLRTSVEKLNSTIASLIEKTTNHEKQLDKHEERIHDLENHRSR